MLAESGVTAAPAAETAVHPPGAGTRVRTATVKAIETAFAACRADERMVGGGCYSLEAIRGNYPSGHGPDDTVGARWNCIALGKVEITAYALCGKLP